MAVSGEFTADWSGADVNPYVDANFISITNDCQILNGGLRTASTSTGGSRIIYTGEVNRAGTLAARVSVQEAGIIWSDPFGPGLFVSESGATQGLGYWLRVNGNDARICICNTTTGWTLIGSPAGGLVISAEDEFELSITPSGGLVAKHNGAQIISITDTTYVSEVSPGASSVRENNNAHSMTSFGADGVAEAGLTLVDVNTNNEIVSNGGIAINCTAGDTVTGVTLDGVALSITSQTVTRVVCSAVDLHTTASAPDAVVSLVITDGATSPAQDVTWRSAPGLVAVVATSIATSPPGLLATTTQTAVVGDIYEGPTTAADGQSALTYVSDGPHRNLDPAVPNATVTEGWFYDVSASAWEEITETTNRADGALAASWKSVPAPPSCVVGVPYVYDMTSILDGDRPITLTLSTGTLPAGLALDSVDETIAGTPTESGEFSGLSIEADNGN